MDMLGKQPAEAMDERKPASSVLALDDNPPSASAIDAAVGDLSDTPLFLSTSLSHMHDALEMIPAENKRDYLEVLRLAPRLIKEESNPIKFLRCQDFNPWKSARSLVLYWEYRKKWFKKRWLLPLNDSGAGALDKDDIALLKSGWISYTVPSDPKKGRFLVINHGFYPRQPVESRARVCFFLCSTASDKAAQTVGLTGVRLIPHIEPDFNSPRLSNARMAFTMISEALPVRFRGVMLLTLQQGGMSRIVNFGFDKISSLICSVLNTQKPFIVTISDVSEAAEKLRPLGVPPDVLPDNHGGTWSYDKLFNWKCVTEQQEEMMKLVKIPWITEVVPLEDKAKEVNALYARRAYHKRKLKLDETQAEAERLEKENVKLKSENELLESLMEQAADILALVEDEQLPEFDVDDNSLDDTTRASANGFGGNFASSWPSDFGSMDYG